MNLMKPRRLLERMLVRQLIPWTLVIGIAVWGVLLLGVRFFAHDATAIAALQTAIIPDDCPSPCFMAIRPGITHSRQVETILNKNESISHLERIMVQNNFTGMRWQWQGDFADWAREGGVVNIWYGDVEWIAWRPRAPLGEVITALGVPDRVMMQFREGFAYYAAPDITLRLIPDCQHWWASDVQIVYGIDINGFRADSWHDMMRAMC